MADLAPAISAMALAMFVVMGVMVTLSKRTRDRAQEALLNDDQPVAKGRSKRQQQVLATMSPDPAIPTIEELVAEEAAATGVNDIPGGDDLDVSLKLRVYWRDEVVRRGCDDGRLEYRIDNGVDPNAAETDDVRLVCVRAGVAVVAPEAPPDQLDDEPGDGDEADELADPDAADGDVVD